MVHVIRNNLRGGFPNARTRKTEEQKMEHTRM
jgi:hypothetical protein